MDGRAVRLTRTEFAILKLLMQNPKQVIPKSRLLDQLPGIKGLCQIIRRAAQQQGYLLLDPRLCGQDNHR